MTDKERIEIPIMQLSLLEPLSSLRAVKSADRKKEDVVVFDARTIRTLWCKMMTVIDEVNRLKKYITQPLVVAKGCEGTIGNNDFMTDDENEDVATIIKWHKEVFPKADFEGQLKKWEEEYGEFLTARTHKDTAEMVAELADLFIVACGIMRFNLIQGNQRMLLWNELRYTHGWSHSTCQEAINKKMRKNRARKWEYLGNGNYHHVKGVED